MPSVSVLKSFCDEITGNLFNDNCNCNRNYTLFTKLPWPGDSEGTFRSSSQAATCPSVYHTRWKLHTVPLIAERQVGKLWIPIFIVFGLTRPGIEPESTASVADALSTRPPIGISDNTSYIFENNFLFFIGLFMIIWAFWCFIITTFGLFNSTLGLALQWKR